MSDNIKVVVKVRPLISRELEDKLSYQWRVKNNTLYQLDPYGKDFGSCFTFDKVYDQDTKTSDVYNDIAKPIVEAATAGFNGTIFAYGQTSSGKTYTMTGTDDSPGIIPLAVLNLFEIIKNVPDRDFLVRVSYIEIYNETVKDLLNVDKKNVKIHETLQGVKVDIEEKVTISPEEVLEIMKLGEANRQTGATNMNEESSRSHSIFQITIESREHIEGEEEVGCVNVSQLNLVDLAGSERAGQTGAIGLRFKEGTHINKSLSALALVIKQLSEDPNKFVNYRDSKLTRILQNSLGGNAKTSIICAVTPAAVEETISTLQFANRAKAIKNKPEVNAVATDATMIQRLTKQMSKLQSQLESKKNIEQDNYKLQKQIQRLQQLILNGFVQRSSVDIMGNSRRKLQQPRRITISTLHPIEESPVPNIPKFCTPSLKYNPMSIPNPADFKPIQNASRLPMVQEECPRLITPPPRDRRANFDDEVIELDSDDDEVTDQPTCSPYHGCFASTKTPPCILRKNAKQAEKNLKDIVELTEREKIYTPSVVELIEKLEQSTNVISKLEDEIKALNKLSQEKDNEMHELKNTISKTQELVESISTTKLDLETLCKDYNTKLTDYEVSYETLKKKSKSREDELLSLLEEQKVKKTEVISNSSKPFEKELSHFMDMSKDISLVNSDNESSITNTNDDDSSSVLQNLVTELQAQLITKTQTANELEQNLADEKEAFNKLETNVEELLKSIGNYQNKISYLEDQINQLQDNDHKLKSTIRMQELHLSTADGDIKSYKSLIQELQNKLIEKENNLNININESLLETMIVNEEKFIANNDNMKNLIQSFKIALDKRNKEIANLKSLTNDFNKATDVTEQLLDKENQISRLHEEVNALKDQIKQNIDIIDNLRTEKDNLKVIEIDLNNNLADMEQENKILLKQTEENMIVIESLRVSNEKLIAVLKDRDLKEEEIVNKNNDLIKQIEEKVVTIEKLHVAINERNLNDQETISKNTELLKELEEKTINFEKLKLNNEDLNLALNDKNLNIEELKNNYEDSLQKIENINNEVAALKEDIKHKESLIESFRKEDIEREKYISEAKTALSKLQDIVTILSGNIQDIPHTTDSFVIILRTIHDSLINLETTANNVLTQKEQLAKLNETLREEIINLVNKHDNDVKSLQLQIENLNDELKLTAEKYEDTQKNCQLLQEVGDIRSELNVRNEEYLNLETKLNETSQNNENLRNDISSKENLISSLKEKESALHMEIQSLLQEKDSINNEFVLQITSNQKAFDDALIAEHNKIDVLENNLKNIQAIYEEKTRDIDKLMEKTSNCIKQKEEYLNNILDAVSSITKEKNIENDLLCQLEFTNGDINVYEKIILTLNIISNQLSLLSSEQKENEDENLKQILLEAKKEIIDLTQLNLKLTEDLFKVKANNKSLMLELESNSDHNKNLCQSLQESKESLQELEKELEVRLKEIDTMESKTIKLKEQLTNHDAEIKNQILELQVENASLKTRSTDLEQVQYQLPVSNQKATVRKSLDNITDSISPPSLLTICCNRIIDTIQTNESEMPSVTPSTSDSSIETNKDIKDPCHHCNKLKSELQQAMDDNFKLSNILKQLESTNQQLVQEQDEVRKEIQNLVEPANELQKKIVNHRTNLSTLTATTYAENRLLKSQVKVLQHHHSRFQNLCQRDIPSFKKELQRLMTILKSDSSFDHNASFKRYSLPNVLDSNASTFKNESTLDGDLLMLDTNVTMTSADSTLLGHDQTCLDMTQAYLCTEVACQTNDVNDSQPNLVFTQMEILMNDNQKMFLKLEALKEENLKLKEQIDKYSYAKPVQRVDVQNSPIKSNLNNTLTEDINTSTRDFLCDKCKKEESQQNTLATEVKLLTQELNEVRAQKLDIAHKNKNLSLEMPSTDALVKKLNILEKEYHGKLQEITQLSNTLSVKNKELQTLQEENDALSTQVMENISEADDLNKELDILKLSNAKLTDKCSHLEQLVNTNDLYKNTCAQCKIKDELVQSLQDKLAESHSKLNRSLSDSDSSSRYNKICTLQNELHAGREDCMELTEEVATIKNQLERSNLSMGQSMDLDESMGESNIFSFNKEFDTGDDQSNKFNLPGIPEESPVDVYTLDKIDCFNYYIERTGAEKENLNYDIKIVDIMKLLYDNIITRHDNEVENLVNKLKDYEECKSQLQTEVNNLNAEYTKINSQLEEKRNNSDCFATVLSEIKNNLHLMSDELSISVDDDMSPKCIANFKDNLLKVLDNGFALSTVSVFDSLIENITNVYQNNLSRLMNEYTSLQQRMEAVTTELHTVNNNLLEIKHQMSEREKEYNLVKAQKERIHEISNAVTLDIVKKEQQLKETNAECYKKLVELNIINSTDIELDSPLNNINVLFDHVIDYFKKQNCASIDKDNLLLEVKISQTTISEKENEIERLKLENKKIQEINNNITSDMVQKENKIQTLQSLHDDLAKVYDSKVLENNANTELIEKLSEEIKALKYNVEQKESAIETLEKQIKSQNKMSVAETMIEGLMQKMKSLEEENRSLKSINQIITNEREAYAAELNKSNEIIKKNNKDIDKMTADVLILRESLNEGRHMVDSLKLEATSLLHQNLEYKERYDDKCRDYSRLEMNMKTHEKTTEIQNKMIIRLQKQKDDNDKIITEKGKRLDDVVQKCVILQKECDSLKLNIKGFKSEIEELTTAKKSLEVRVLELKTELESVRKSQVAVEESKTSRYRRESDHVWKESDRQDEELNKIEAVFDSRFKPDDLFMDVDDDSSNRSTPLRLSRGRDSLASRPDQDEEHPSRPSSMQAIRKRRQSTHDMHRSALRNTPSPHESSRRLLDDSSQAAEHLNANSVDSEVTSLKERLTACQQELEELKEKYRELDDECETCAQYLREREEQCARLKSEKIVLQQQLAEANEKLQSQNPDGSKVENKCTFVDAFVNTNEDWANLHSVVVDRMSYDAEVEKNKKLTKTIEELRFKKQELKVTISKMQKALERNANKDSSRELDAVKQELKSCKQELAELKRSYKELDEECETCAEYLKERDEQCRKLKEAKAALEAKLREHEDSSGSVAQSMRKKRQSQHDQNRDSTVELNDAATETSDDFLSYQVERDNNSRKSTDDAQIKRLKMAVEKLSQQKLALEQQLMVAPLVAHPPVYVATGSAIVQNQQLTDVMKENHKLKKLNAKLINICKKRKAEMNRENEDPSLQG